MNADNESMSEALHIAIIGPTRPLRGGISHHTTLLARALQQRHHVRFFSYIRQYPGWLYPGRNDREPAAADVREPGVFYTLDSLNPWTWIKTARQICAEKVDLLIIPWWTVFWAPQVAFMTRSVRRHSNAKIVFLCHNVSDHETNRVKAFIADVVLRESDAILCHSDEEYAEVKKRFPKKVVQKIYHPSYEALVGKTQSESGIDPGAAPKILFFGFIRPYKGLEVLLRAMPEIHKRTGAVLHVVGEPWGNLEEITAQLRRLENEGMVFSDLRYVPTEEIGAIFNSVQLAVLPYRSATGCGVAQLAFGAGKPVVASDVGGLRDAVRDGDNGLLVKPGDDAALAEAVSQALSPSMYPRLAAGARLASQRFSWDGIVDIIERIAAACFSPLRR
jgi:glycosyltransferase involved in cell wall biosynthesis